MDFGPAPRLPELAQLHTMAISRHHLVSGAVVYLQLGDELDSRPL